VFRYLNRFYLHLHNWFFNYLWSITLKRYQKWAANHYPHSSTGYTEYMGQGEPARTSPGGFHKQSQQAASQDQPYYVEPNPATVSIILLKRYSYSLKTIWIKGRFEYELLYCCNESCSAETATKQHYFEICKIIVLWYRSVCMFTLLCNGIFVWDRQNNFCSGKFSIELHFDWCIFIP